MGTLIDTSVIAEKQQLKEKCYEERLMKLLWGEWQEGEEEKSFCTAQDKEVTEGCRVRFNTMKPRVEWVWDEPWFGGSYLEDMKRSM